MLYSPSQDRFYLDGIQYDDEPDDVIEVTYEDMIAIVDRAPGATFVVYPDGRVVVTPPSLDYYKQQALIPFTTRCATIMANMLWPTIGAMIRGDMGTANAYYWGRNQLAAIGSSEGFVAATSVDDAKTALVAELVRIRAGFPQEGQSLFN